MSGLEWNDGLSVGVDAIDKDHKDLLRLINQLSDAIVEEDTEAVTVEIFEKLEDYIRQHFSREERMMAQCDYADLDEHRKQHRKFVEQIPELKRHLLTAENVEVAKEVCLFLINWLLNHIVIDDMSYAKTLHDNGLSSKKDEKKGLLDRLIDLTATGISLNKRIYLGFLLPIAGLSLLIAGVLWSYFESTADIQSGFVVFAVVLSAVLIPSFFVSWLLSQSIIAPVRRFTYAIKRMSEGHRDVRFTDDLTSDDIGEMFRAYEDCRRKLLQVDILSAVRFERQSVSIDQREREKEEYLKLASTDVLTGAMNRRRFFEVFEQETRRASRYQHGLSLMMLDIDHFKNLNDTYGHAVGDLVLKEFYQCCFNSVRETDIVARIGGEEFAILMPETDLYRASELADRLCHIVSSHEIAVDEHIIKITVSIGVSEWSETVENIADLMIKADKALYEAKDTGRNRAVVG